MTSAPERPKVDLGHVLLTLERPGGEARVALKGHGPATLIEMVRVDAAGALLARVAFKPEELDRVGAAIAEARRLTLGLPDRRGQDLAAQELAGVRPRRKAG